MGPSSERLAAVLNFVFGNFFAMANGVAENKKGGL